MVQGQLFRFSIKNDKFKYLDTTILYEYHNCALASPSFYKYGGTYIMIWLATRSYNNGGRDCEMKIRTSASFDSHFDNERDIIIESGDYTPWHMSLFSHNDKLYTVIVCIKDGVSHRLYQMLGEFNDDLTKVHIYQKPLVDLPSYRGAAYVAQDGTFVLYSTTVRYRIKGSKSVDGKDVVMACMSFDDLLNELRNSE